MAHISTFPIPDGIKGNNSYSDFNENKEKCRAGQSQDHGVSPRKAGEIRPASTEGDPELSTLTIKTFCDMKRSFAEPQKQLNEEQVRALWK